MAKERTRERNFEEDAVLLLHRGRRGLFHLLFERTGLILLLLLLQIGLLVLAFVRIGEYYYGSALTASLIASLVVINKPGDPTIKITWLLLIFLLPVLGIPLYFYVNADVGYRLTRHRLAVIGKETQKYLPDASETRRLLAESDPGLAALSEYVERWGGHGLYAGSDVRYFPSGEETFEEMLRQLELAEQFIFLEFFIIEEGYMWGRILNVLERKVREGVEVRVMYDGTCVVSKLPYSYYKELRSLGIQCHMYAPPRPLMSTYYNNRDHRKILVVDGRVAFTGGVNLADEYINRTSRFGHWKDTAVMVSGLAVQGFTRMFLQMWNVESWQKEAYAHYLDASAPVEGAGFVMPYGDQPLDDERVAQMVYMDILNRARRYVHIMTPYLILNQEMVTALIFAAKRGVDVKLILPGTPDKKTVFAISRSYYKELLAGGVKIYEYTPGFVHGKMFVSDDKTAVVGSINLDYRSLFLHFECAALFHNCGAVLEVERDMQETLRKCAAVEPGDHRRGSLWWRLFGWFFRPLGPLI